MKSIIKMCAWCRRVAVDEEWETLTEQPDCEITHGMCEECYGRIEQQLEAGE